MSSKGKFYMTTAIAYTSGKPHIGNTYEVVLAVQMRSQDSAVRKVMMFTSRPERTNMVRRSRRIPRRRDHSERVCGQCSRGEVKRIWDLMNTSYDNFVRTTDEDHEKQVKRSSKNYMIQR